MFNFIIFAAAKEPNPMASVFVLVILAMLFLVAFVVESVRRIKMRQRSDRMHSQMYVYASKDRVWNPEYILHHASKIFYRYQKDWQSMNLEAMRPYVTNEYFNYLSLTLLALHQLGRTVPRKQVIIKEVNIVGAVDDIDNNKDEICIRFDTMSTSFPRSTYGAAPSSQKDQVAVQAFDNWHFTRAGNEWKLAGVGKLLADVSSPIKPSPFYAKLAPFAHHNGMYYSPESWGVMLLPERGQLFTTASYLGDNSVNNNDEMLSSARVTHHIIGMWAHNHLVQLYIFVKSGLFRYIVGQISLPKSYGGIIVHRRDSKTKLRRPPGYFAVNLEWGDFNRRYKVFATHADQVTSFELLNPSFMAWLYDRNIKVDIEVVDNVVYLYSKVSVGENRYPEMMEILKRSYKELKL